MSLHPVDSISLRKYLTGAAIISVIPVLAVELLPQLNQVMDSSPYLVFHNVAEFFSIVVSLSIFGLGWFAYDQNRNRHALFLSAAFLAIGLVDYMHTLGYTGMPPLITPNTPNKSTQFWIAVRLLSAAAFLCSAFIYPGSSSRWLSKVRLITAALAIPSAVFAGVIFFPGYVPATFIQGVGLTTFKVVSEYAVIFLLILAFILYWRRLSRTGDRQIECFLAAFVLCIFSELVFAVYSNVFDTYNVLGHIYKVLAFGLIYKGLFVVSIRKPYDELLLSHEELRRNRDMLFHIMNSIPQSIFWKDRECVYLGCNQVFARQAGMDNPDDIAGRCDFDLPWSQQESESYRADDREVMGRAEAKQHIIESQHHADGTVVWLDTTKIPLTDSSGNVSGVLGVYEDITRRKQTEEELNEAFLFNQQIINCAHEGIIVYDRNLRCRVWNPFMEQISGVKSAEVVGTGPLDVFSFFPETGVTGRLQRVLQGQTVETVEFPFRSPGVAKSGWATGSSAPLLNAKGEIIGIISTVRDLTVHRETEDQLRQAQKMEALGQLAGGVAHDFNNMLQVIMGYAALLTIDATTAQKERIAEILAASERAAELTSGLLSYSRKQVFKIEVTDLGKLLGRVEKFLRRILGEDIILSLDQSPGPLMAAVDPTHIQQVFVNLATNARDAMPSGGKLTIRLRRIETDEEFVQVHGFGVVGPSALITVSDTGTGIPKEQLQKIFEPFFTTKEVGSGTGLGLSIVYGIISQHNGGIMCDSEVGAGTRFQIYIPLAREELQTPEVAMDMPEDEEEGITVLVAEDDPAVRKITRSVLELHGCAVLEASNGREALEIFRTHLDAIDIVLLDALMPELNGAETLAAMRVLKPGAKALFTSGYAREILGGKMLLPDDAELLSKPAKPAHLINAIRRTVRGGPS